MAAPALSVRPATEVVAGTTCATEVGVAATTPLVWLPASEPQLAMAEVDMNSDPDSPLQPPLPRPTLCTQHLPPEATTWPEMPLAGRDLGLVPGDSGCGLDLNPSPHLFFF